MIKTIQIVWVLAALALVAGSPVMPTEKPTPRSTCSGFSEEQQHRDPPLSWRFRSCTTSEGGREVQVQFRNRSRNKVEFEYRLWTQPLKSCSAASTPSAIGKGTLGPAEAQDWPYTVTPLAPGAEFSGRIWVCVKEKVR